MILGITGTNGAGKGTVVDYLADQKGFTHYSVREALVAEVVKRGLEINRTTLGDVGTELREEFGPSYFSNLFTQKAKEDGITNFLIESIRTVSEAQNIKAHGGKIVVVDAERTVRYQRILARGTVTDHVSFEEFCAQEDREMVSEDPSNPAKMSISSVMDIADYSLINNGTIEELDTTIDAMLSKFKNEEYG